MRVYSVCVLALLVSLWASVAWAQTAPPPTSYVLRIYAPGQPVSAVTIQAIEAECDQPRFTGSNLNPTTWRWFDPANPDRDCMYRGDAARLAALPDGGYEGAIVAVAGIEGSESPRVPFGRRRPIPPAAVTGVRVTD
jgi:hypothetical protein